ncbi:Serine phosphatase RsbU, regulator of sigma subunit [Actinokineospora spheciospongiae]|uniref:histidine kinase n=2 Tax=Actinokineospora spheciospongiae TaxID=909613 RepID=W7IJG0_9PSEU|nr:Serine phosphatase RsbU, regulator of sigma subunit [Actinokineospora spheciospongiae]
MLSGMSGRKQWSLARQLLVLQVVIVGVLVAGGAALAWADVADRARESSAATVVALARAVADAPSVAQAVRSPDPAAVLQPYAQAVLADTDVDFVTIMGTDGVRFTHPNPAEIGKRFLGNTGEALAGRAFTETYTGTLGPSVRAVVPVFDADRRVIALVSAGITLEAISAQVAGRVLPLLGVAAVGLLAGAVGTYLVSRRLRRQTGGLAPARLGQVIEYHEAILHSVREGLVLVGPDHRVTLCNDGVRALLDLPADAEGRRVDELGLPDALTARLLAATEMRDELHLTDTRVLVVNSSAVRFSGRDLGSVVTIRDRTDLQALTGELDSVRGFAESLRSQAHEAANRLHTVVSLVELGRGAEAVEFATGELAIAQRLTDRVVAAVAEPVLAALLLGKAAEASERGVELVVSPDTEIADSALGAGTDEPPTPRDLVTILGNLIDNAVDAAVEGAAAARPTVHVSARTTPDELVLRVADSGPGLPDVPSAFRRGFSTKAGADGRGLGLALVGQAVRRAGGTIEVGRAGGSGDVDESSGIDEMGEADRGGAVFTVRLPLRGRS